MTRDDMMGIAAIAANDTKESCKAKEILPFVERFGELLAEQVAAEERQAIASICDELEAHWSDYKDAALLNDDVALSNAASGEPRAARAIKEAVLARNGKPFEWRPKG